MKQVRREPRPRTGRKAGLGGVIARLRPAAVVVVPVLVLALAAATLLALFGPVFALRSTEFHGNEHLTDDEVRLLAGLRTGEGMLGISSREMHRKLRESPWIRSVSVRKDFPGRVEIRIREAVPFALLDMKGKLFLVDDAGRMLEELRSDTIPFLPVIASDPFKEKEAYREAVSLVLTLRKSGLLSSKERIEIVAHAPQEMLAVFDGLVVKIGEGDHEEKIKRYLETEEEIRKRNIPVDYIDLRFAKKVVVKPVREVIR